MSVNFAREYKKFEKEHEKLRIKCLTAGMTEEEYEELEQFDLQCLNRYLAYLRRTQPLISLDGTFEDNEQNPLIKKFQESLSYDFEEPDFGRYDWLENISVEPVASAIRMLRPEQKELLTLVYKDGLTCTGIAGIYSKSKQAVNQRFNRTMSFLKTYSLPS